MKKIFAISVLSVMAVVATTDAWATEEIPNYNLATANYVEDRYNSAVGKAKSLVVTSDKKTTVGGTVYVYEQTGSDDKAPTIKYMEDSIADAVAGVDTSGLVAKTQVETSAGVDMNGNAISGELTPDKIVPTVGMVEANFAPRIADAAYIGTPGGTASVVGNIDDVTNLPSGEYSVIVSVDGSGNVSFRWVPIQIDGCTSTDGYTCGPA